MVARHEPRAMRLPEQKFCCHHPSTPKQDVFRELQETSWPADVDDRSVSIWNIAVTKQNAFHRGNRDLQFGQKHAMQDSLMNISSNRSILPCSGEAAPDNMKELARDLPR